MNTPIFFLYPEKYLEKVIMGISGWRKIFADDQKVESTSKKIPLHDQYFCILLAYQIKKFFQKKSAPLIVARDSRPTGKPILNILEKTFSLYNLNYISLGINSLPETLALVKKNYSGFVYVTASHNPVGYNGFKIGENEVLNSKKSQQLITSFKKLFFNPFKSQEIIKRYLIKEKKIKISQIPLIHEAHKAYSQLIEKIINPSKKKLPPHFLSNHQQTKIACDFNGSARIKSADQTIYQKNQIKLLALNQKIGIFPHQIVPEGKALLTIKSYLIQHFSKNILFGYTVDCDGDRGNFAFYSSAKKVIIPNAQSIFLLMVVCELIFLETFYPKQKNGLVVNGPTTLNIDWIAKKFKTPVFRAEVGEANLFALAKKKKKAGYVIRIMGEGSNGGSIISPSRVRDPLVTCFCFYKFFGIQKKNQSQTPILKEKLIQKLKLPSTMKEIDNRFFFCQLLPHITPFYSSSLFEKEALVKIKKKLSQKKLKKNYEKIFITTRQKNQPWLKQLNFKTFQFINYEGSQTRIGKGRRTGEETGGLKVQFYNGLEKQGFIWFRASKTEPVFRISAEIKGKKDQLKKLLQFQRKLLIQASQL